MCAKTSRRNITVLLVDDHALVRRGFRRLIEDESDITVVGEASESAQALHLAEELKPDVAVMDCGLTGSDGVLTAAQIVKRCPQTAVLMCSMHTEEAWVRRAREAGARGYVFKNAMDPELTSAIRRVAAGELVYDPRVLKSRRDNMLDLSPRELEVLQLIVDGKSNREIARHLDLSANTVAAHRSNIMNRLRIHKTAGLVAFAIRNGLAKVK